MSEAMPLASVDNQPGSEHFVHLHAHSEFSLAEGLLKVKSTVAEAVNRQIPAIALTDRNNLFALVKFYENSLSKGVKPILGAELWITPKIPGRLRESWHWPKTFAATRTCWP